MRKKLVCVLLLFFLLSSNLSFGMMSLFSFVANKNIHSLSNIINIQDQYSLFFNIPKDFVDICVKIQDDLKIFKVRHSNNLFFNNDISYFFNDFLATLTNQLRLKTYYTYEKAYTFDKICNYQNFFLILFSILFIFYILRYVGLLKLFNAHDYTNIKQYRGLNLFLCLNF